MKGMETDPIFSEDLEKVVEQIVEEKGFKDKTFFITGATGVIGSVLVKALCEANQRNHMNIEIYCLIRDEKKAKLIYEDFYQSNYLHFIKGDVREPICLGEKVDYIIHAASITTSRIFVQNPVETLLTIVEGTKNVLEFAKEQNVDKMLYISSMEVYGYTSRELDSISETDLGYIDILNERSSYSEGKRAAECLCKCYEAEYHIPVIIARLAQTFGAGADPKDSRIFAQLARSLMKKENIVLHTAGLSVGNYCYISDCMRGLFLLLTSGMEGEAYTVVNEICTMRIKDMAEMVADKLGNHKIKVIYEIPDNVKKYGYAPDSTARLSSAKLKKLGWKPEIDLEMAYARMIESFKYQKGIKSEEIC